MCSIVGFANLFFATLSAFFFQATLGNEKIPVKFMLYMHSQLEWILIPSDLSVLVNRWNSCSLVKITIHGYNPDPQAKRESIFKKMKIINREYAKMDTSINNVLVDWYTLATYIPTDYSKAAANAPKVGHYLGQFLIKLYNRGFISDLKNVHLIGYSIGGHIAGFAGQVVLEELKHRIGRITGLDPAGPGFQGNGVTVSTADILDSTDAEYVDILHCNSEAGNSDIISAGIKGSYGTNVQSGDSDFYLNGGMRQDAQCTPKEDIIEGCSHRLCPLYFALSISMKVSGCHCENWTKYIEGQCRCSDAEAGIMGDRSVTSNAEGKYFVKLEHKVTENSFA